MWKPINVIQLTQVNWSAGKYQMIPVTFRSSNANNATLEHLICVSFDENLSNAVSISCESPRAQVWSLPGGHLQKSLVGHDGTISTAKMNSKFVISGGVDRTVRVWDVQTGQCLRVLAGHDDEIECLQFDNEVVVSGSLDHTIRVNID